MTRAELESFERIAGEQLQELGYELASPAKRRPAGRPQLPGSGTGAAADLR